MSMWSCRSSIFAAEDKKVDSASEDMSQILTLRTSDAGIPALRKLPYGVERRYTGFAQSSLWRRKPVYRRHGMSTPGVGRRYTGFVFYEQDGGDRWGNVCGRSSVQSTSAIFVWRALRNLAMADFEENVGTTREVAVGDRVRRRRELRRDRRSWWSRGRDRRQDGGDVC